MKNYEKYAEKIREKIRGYGDKDLCSEFIKPYILKSDTCNGITCGECHTLQMIWLLEEYEEPEVDWSNVKVDTPILVRNNECDKWTKRYFAKYEDGWVYVWLGGRTSWNEANMIVWNFAKLAESEEGGVK